MTKWNPMSSAPQDGTWIRARGYDFGDRTRKKHTAIAFFEDGNWNEVGSEGTHLYYLIEWQPFAGTSRS
jgi:hypothetical protein